MLLEIGHHYEFTVEDGEFAEVKLVRAFATGEGIIAEFKLGDDILRLTDDEVKELSRQGKIKYRGRYHHPTSPVVFVGVVK